MPGARLYNEYGPTEATVWASVFEATAWRGMGTVPIGRPIPGARVCILDARQRLAPPGVAGELCIAGPGVAAGYVGNAEETGGRFVEDPLDPGAGRRLYRTGDAARWLPGGDIEFLGRLDGQVKVRGYRIEPAEIEAALLEHPDIDDAAVLLTNDLPSEAAVSERGVDSETVIATLLTLPDAERESLLRGVEQYGEAEASVLLAGMVAAAGELTGETS